MTNGADIVVLGLGRSGRAVAEYAADLLTAGEIASVTVLDGAASPELRVTAAELEALGVRVLLGVNGLDQRFDLCVASPGLPPHSELLSWARSACARVISELEFAFERSDAPWAAVTGTNGKTTTTALLAHLLCTGGLAAQAVGNIGVAATDAVRSRDVAVFVAEVSSFQLALADTFHPKVAVLLNLTEDHVNWHGSFDAYRADKARVFRNLSADDLAVIDVDDAGSAPFAATLSARGIPVARVSLRELHPGGASLIEGMLVMDRGDQRVELVGAHELKVKGAHNVSNALAASVAAHALGVSADSIREGLRTFCPVPHRLEFVGERGGVEWFNDSKATNPDAVIKAIEAFDGEPLIVLLGGRNKGSSFDVLASEVSARARAAVLFGEASSEISAAFSASDIRTERAANLADAVRIAASIATPGDTVILSPACASFDEFDSYEQRGEEFKHLVEMVSIGAGR